MVGVEVHPLTGKGATRGSLQHGRAQLSLGLSGGSVAGSQMF